MSMIIGNILPPVTQTLTGTSVTDIGSSMEDKFRVLTGFSFVNNTGAAVTCQLYWTPSGGSDQLLWSGSVETYETEPDQMRVFPIRLDKSDKIRAKGANNVVVVLYYTLTYQTAPASPLTPMPLAARAI